MALPQDFFEERKKSHNFDRFWPKRTIFIDKD